MKPSLHISALRDQIPRADLLSITICCFKKRRNWSPLWGEFYQNPLPTHSVRKALACLPQWPSKNAQGKVGNVSHPVGNWDLYYKFAKWLDEKLKPLSTNEHTIDDIFSFADNLQDLEISNHDILVSYMYDVTALFTEWTYLWTRRLESQGKKPSKAIVLINSTTLISLKQTW